MRRVSDVSGEGGGRGACGSLLRDETVQSRRPYCRRQAWGQLMNSHQSHVFIYTRLVAEDEGARGGDLAQGLQQRLGWRGTRDNNDVA